MATILIVDDHAATRKLLISFLEDSKHRLLEAADGEEGLQIARAERPDLIITDIVMPKMDGVQFVQSLRQDPSLAKLPVIFYTATYRLHKARILAEMCGVSLIIEKSVKSDYILKAVHEALHLLPRDMGHVRTIERQEEYPSLQKLDIQPILKLKEILQASRPTPQNIQELLTKLESFALQTATLFELGLKLNKEDNPKSLLSLFCSAIQDIFNAKYAVVGILDDDQKAFEYFFAEGMSIEEEARLATLSPKVGIFSEVLSNRRPRRLDNLAGNPKRAGLPAFHPPVNSILCTPIFSSTKTYGWFYVTDKLQENTIFHNQDEELAMALASLIAITYENVRFAEKIQQHAIQLELEIIRGKQKEKEIRKLNEELKKALAQLEQTQEQMIQEERLRAMGKMASGIVHGFNNAMAPVLGYSDLMLMNPKNLNNKEKVLRAFQVVNTAAKDAANVVKRLREFYRRREEIEVPESISVKELLEEVITLTQARWKDQALAKGLTIKIKTKVQEPEVPLFGNPRELREALTNLIFNAVDAMPEGGTLTLSSHPIKGGVLLEVRDTGVGMSKEALNHCFEPFFTTKSGQGTGLGLSMVFGIIKRHGGTIQVSSQVGKGTAFHITLPTQGYAVQASQASSVCVVPRSLHILLVEDEPLVCEVLMEYLKEDGHTAVVARNGKEGLEKFHKGRFDLVVTDYGMPEISGNELATLIKKSTPNQPVILLTGFGTSMGSLPNVDLTLEKPITLASLREGITKAIETSHLPNQVSHRPQKRVAQTKRKKGSKRRINN